MTKSETLNFGADVSRLLDIVAHALYSNHDVFLRELISNASDACDRLRYEAIQKPELTADKSAFHIHIYKITDSRTLTIVDNGIGMSRKELIDNLGTIAKSGTAKLMEKMGKTKDQNDKLSLIGQFGVGFYASYMVADTVKVISHKAGGKSTHVWESDGRTGFDIREASTEEKALLDGGRGTAIILNIKDDASEFLIDEKIKQTVQQYSDHIDVKILLNTPEETEKGEGAPINTASAIWARSKNEVTQEQYNEFYKHITHGFDEPLMTAHWRAEGVIEYSALLFIPTMRPWDLYDPTRKNTVKLYVKRVFISDQMEDLMYPWLRFVRGVIDSADLPLNISRETLQYNPIIAKIRSGVTRRILKDLDKLAQNDTESFNSFWGQFGAAVKEGLYDAIEHRDEIFKICRFFSTHDNGQTLISLDSYIDRMDEKQKHIYYISGDNADMLNNSPQLEAFKKQGIEVLFFTDTIDDFWLQNIQEYKGKQFKSVTKGDIDLKGDDENRNEMPGEEIQTFLNTLKELLQEDVSDVRASKRLTDSPVCLIAPDDGVDMNMERVLKIHQNYNTNTKPVLEINEEHPLIKTMMTLNENANDNNQSTLSEAALLLLDQAHIIQGQPIKDPARFAKSMSKFMENGLNT